MFQGRPVWPSDAVNPLAGSQKSFFKLLICNSTSLETNLLGEKSRDSKSECFKDVLRKKSSRWGHILSCGRICVSCGVESITLIKMSSFWRWINGNPNLIYGYLRFMKFSVKPKSASFLTNLTQLNGRKKKLFTMPLFLIDEFSLLKNTPLLKKLSNLLLVR